MAQGFGVQPPVRVPSQHDDDFADLMAFSALDRVLMIVPMFHAKHGACHKQLQWPVPT